MPEKTIAIIPARGGSKRVPRKNIMNFNGMPMLAWTIKAAIKSKMFSEVHVSTEDEIIANVAKEYGAKVPFLRDNYYDDFSDVSQVTSYHLTKISTDSLDNVALLMPNCPLRTSENIINLVNFFYSDKEYSVLSAFDYGFCNPWWAHKIDKQKRATSVFKGQLNERSQDLEKLLCPSGAIWISNIEKIISEQDFYSEGYRFYEIPFYNAIDIDSKSDLVLANIIFKTLNSDCLA